MKQQISWNGWRRACKRVAGKLGCDHVVYMGDKDIAEAFFHWSDGRTRFAGEWDGSYGKVEDIPNEAAAPKFDKDSVHYNRLVEFGKWIEL